MQEDLVDFYRAKISSVPLSPFYGRIKEKLTNIYVPPSIRFRESEQRFRPNTTFPNDKKQLKQEPVEIKNYADLFGSNDKWLTEIYIQGEPGMGKSTFAAKMTLDWCDSVRSTTTSTSQCERENSTEASNSNTFFTDVHTLGKFKFLFFVSLRHCNRNEFIIEEIIQNLIFSELNRRYCFREMEFIERVLSEENCLVILDGLDEWIHHFSSNCQKKHTAIPQRRAGGKCTFVTLTRPWKLSDPLLEEIPLEILYDIKGVVSNTELCKKFFKNIRRLSQVTRDFQDFEKHTLQLQALLKIPILATSIFCLWCNECKFPESICGIYSSMLDMLGKKSHTYQGDENNEYLEKDTLLKCFEKRPWCKQNKKLLNSLGKLAFYTMYTDEKETAVVFTEETVNNHLNENEKTRALQAGILTSDLSLPMYQKECKYWFLHKTFQEYLAAFYMAKNITEHDKLKRIIIEFYTETTRSVRSIKMFFQFLCGLNISIASDLSENICSVATREVEEKINTENSLVVSQTQSVNIVPVITDVQEILFQGYIESIANGFKDAYLDLRHITDLCPKPILGHSEKLKDDQRSEAKNMQTDVDNSKTDIQRKTLINLCSDIIETILLFNLSCICEHLCYRLGKFPNLKYVVLSREGSSTPEKRIRKQSKDESFIHVEGSFSQNNITFKSETLTHLQIVGIVCPVELILTACKKLEFIKILKSKVKVIMETKQLRHCDIEGHDFSSDTTAEVLQTSPLMELLHLDNCEKVTEIIQSLSNKSRLQNLIIERLDLSNCDINLCVPDSIRDVLLQDVTMTSTSWKHFIKSISKSSNLKKCQLNGCFLCEDEHFIPTLHVIVSCSKITVNCDTWELGRQSVKICKYFIFWKGKRLKKLIYSQL